MEDWGLTLGYKTWKEQLVDFERNIRVQYSNKIYFDKVFVYILQRLFRLLVVGIAYFA